MKTYHESVCFSIFTLLAIIDISAVQSSAQTFIQNVIFFIDTILDKIKLMGVQDDVIPLTETDKNKPAMSSH